MSRDKVHILVALLAGFAVGSAIIHAAGGKPLAVMRPPVNMAVQYRPPLSSQSKFMQPMQPMRARASSVVANAASDAEAGRREIMRKMIAGAFGLAVAASNRDAVAAGDPKFDKVFGKAYVEPDLEKAEDFTSYNKVQIKKGLAKSKEVAPAEEKGEKPGSVEIQPLLVPAVIAGSAVISAAVPALLSPGETAKRNQDAQRSSKGKKAPVPAKKKGVFR